MTAKEGRDKWHYDVTVKEGKALLPAHLERMLEEMKKSSGGDLDFPLLSLVVSGLSGKVSREGDGVSFEARGSGQKYRLTGDAGLKGLLDSGKTLLTLSGRLTQPKGGLPVLELTEAKDSTK